MKKLILSCCIFFATYYSAIAQLKVLSNGNVGVNNSTPAYRLDIEGTGRFSNWTDVLIDWTGDYSGAVIYPENDVYLQLGKGNKRLNCVYAEYVRVNNLVVLSDDNIKTNKRKIEDPISIINSLQGKKYNFTTKYLSSAPDSFYQRIDMKRDQYGYLASEILAVLPELVTFDSASKLYGVNYVGIIPILTEAVKQQQSIINSLQEQITFLQNCCNSSSGKTMKQSNLVTDNINNKNTNETKAFSSEIPILYQNNPNPFNDKTEIKYYLPALSKNIKIIVYNLNGQQLFANTINNNGQGLQSINIDGGGLAAGSYYYTLLVDNAEIDTKKMILYK